MCDRHTGKHAIEASKNQPVIPAPNLVGIPHSMREWDQWVLWTYERPRDRWTKVPQMIRRTLSGTRRLDPAKSTDPATWSSFDDHALTLVVRDELHGCSEGIGLGFVLTDRDPFCVIDLDDCRNRDTGDLTPEAQRIISEFDTYTEVSPSGTGVKLFIQGKKPGPRCKNTARSIEVYEARRFLAMTGNGLAGRPSEPQCRQEQLNAFYAELFPIASTANEPASTIGGEALPPPLLPTNLLDHEIVERATNARNGYRFDRLWRGSAADHNGDRSAADFALASILAFWVGPDVQRVIGLMLQSGLRRAKWEDRPEYLSRTVERAISSRSTWYTGGREMLPVPCQAQYDDGDSHDPAEHCTKMRFVTDDLVQAVREDHEEQAKYRAESQQIMTRTVALIRADEMRYHCPHCRPILMRSRSGGKPYIVWARCQHWQCEGCRRWLVLREYTSAAFHFALAEALEALYEFGCNDGQWEAMRRRIKRAGGEYHRTRDGEGWYVVTNRPIQGAIPVGIGTALGCVELLLGEWRGDYRPITTSRGWSLLQEEGRDELSCVGMCDPTLDPQRAIEIVEAFEASVKPCTRSPDRPTHLIRCWRIDRNSGWDQATFDRFAQSLYDGEVAPDWSVVRFDFGDIPQASTIAEDVGLAN